MSNFPRRVFLPAVFALTIALTAPTGCKSKAKAADSDVIKVGQYASLTGETSTFGEESNAGVQFAVDEINAAGGIDVGGKKLRVEVETQDDQSKPDEAKNIAVKFAADPAVVAVLGEVASTRSITAAPVYQQAGIPMISPSSTNPEVTEKGEFIFRVCFIDPFQGFVMAKFAAEELKAKSVAILRDQSQDYSVGLANAFTEAFTKMGGKISKDVSYNAKDADFRSQLAQVKGADAIFIPGYYGEVGTIARQAREQGINVPLLGGDGWDSPKLIEGAGGP
ncbi:MAG: ABC transporter substrate-binding protein, partial [Armatimonadaceae bacterium]